MGTTASINVAPCHIMKLPDELLEAIGITVARNPDPLDRVPGDFTAGTEDRLQPIFNPLRLAMVNGRFKRVFSDLLYQEYRFQARTQITIKDNRVLELQPPFTRIERLSLNQMTLPQDHFQYVQHLELQYEDLWALDVAEWEGFSAIDGGSELTAPWAFILDESKDRTTTSSFVSRGVNPTPLILNNTKYQPQDCLRSVKTLKLTFDLDESIGWGPRYVPATDYDHEPDSIWQSRLRVPKISFARVIWKRRLLNFPALQQVETARGGRSSITQLITWFYASGLADRLQVIGYEGYDGRAQYGTLASRQVLQTVMKNEVESYLIQHNNQIVQTILELIAERGKPLAAKDA